MKTLFQILALSSLLFTACGPEISEKNQEKLDELTSNVDSLVNKMESIDSVELSKNAQHFFESMQFIKNDMNDTLETDIIYKLDLFIRLKKGMGFLTKEYSKLKQELMTVQEQMRTLNQDVDNGLVEDSRFINYYQLEKENYEMLEAATSQFFLVHENTVAEYEERMPFVDSLINDYKVKPK